MSDNPDDQEPGWDALSIILWPVSAWFKFKQWAHDKFTRDNDSR